MIRAQLVSTPCYCADGRCWAKIECRAKGIECPVLLLHVLIDTHWQCYRCQIDQTDRSVQGIYRSEGMATSVVLNTSGYNEVVLCCTA